MPTEFRVIIGRRTRRARAPLRYEIRSRNWGWAGSETVEAIAEVIVHRRFTEYSILIPDRRKANWKRKQKHEAYVSGVCANDLVPLEGSGRTWGSQANELLVKLYWSAVSANKN